MSTTGSRRHSRELALQVLFQKDFTETLAVDQALDYFIENFEAPIDVREYASLLIKGVFANLKEIDQAIKANSANWKFDRLSFVDKNILRVAVFELLHLSKDIPPNVVINEAVEIAKRFSNEDSTGFINGILDKIAKTRHP